MSDSIRAAPVHPEFHALLVVEDDALISGSLSRALRNRGYDVAVATTVAEADAEIKRRRPDLILLDLGLSDGDGIDLAVSVVDAHPDLPVVAVTARADDLDVVVGLEAGTVDYVTKPFRLAELLARIGAHLRLARNRRGIWSRSTPSGGSATSSSTPQPGP